MPSLIASKLLCCDADTGTILPYAWPWLTASALSCAFQNTPCQQMVIFLKDTSAADLNAIVEFMYKGSVNVAQSQLASFIKTAEMLQIRGLSGEEDKVSARVEFEDMMIVIIPGLLASLYCSRPINGVREIQ